MKVYVGLECVDDNPSDQAIKHVFINKKDADAWVNDVHEGRRYEVHPVKRTGCKIPQ